LQYKKVGSWARAHNGPYKTCPCLYVLAWDYRELNEQGDSSHSGDTRRYWFHRVNQYELKGVYLVPNGIGNDLGGTTWQTLLVQYCLVCCTRASSCQGPSWCATCEETRIGPVALDKQFPLTNKIGGVLDVPKPNTSGLAEIHGNTLVSKAIISDAQRACFERDAC